MKYRILGLLGVMALTAGSLLAQDYDDIYYDASKAPKTTKVKVETPVKTVAVYGEVPEKYKVVVKDNYREERDVDEYNRRGAYEPQYEIDINGDTIYMDSTYVDDDLFANTRRIERFYNPDVVILSDDDDLVELYYDESPTINLIVGSDYAYASYGWASSYYPWYTGWYSPWYTSPWYYSPWHYGWYTPYNYGYWNSYYWGWNYRPWWSYNSWYWSGGHWGWPGVHHYTDWGTHRPGGSHHYSNYGYTDHRRGGLAPNRNGRPRVDSSGGRNQVSSRRTASGRSSGVGMPGSRNRSGGVSSRSGNMGSRNSSGVSSGGSRSYSGGSRSSSGYSGGSRSSGSYSGGSRSSGSGSSRSYSSGSSHSSGSYSSGSSGGSRSSGGGGGSHGGSSGGGGRRH